MHHHTPPIILQIALQLDAERAVIPSTVQTTVNFARLENEPAPLAETDDFLHALGVGRLAHNYCRLHGSENIVEAFVPNAFPSAADTAAATTKRFITFAVRLSRRS